MRPTSRFSVANPNLEPERSEKTSVLLEYYFEPAGTAGVHVFHSNLDNSAERTDWMPSADFGYGSDPIYGSYEFRGWQNINETRTIKGIELNYTQQLAFFRNEFLRSTRVFATFSQFTSTPRPNGFVPKAASGGVSFRWRGFNAKMAGTWRRSLDRRQHRQRDKQYLFLPRRSRSAERALHLRRRRRLRDHAPLRDIRLRPQCVQRAHRLVLSELRPALPPDGKIRWPVDSRSERTILSLGGFLRFSDLPRPTAMWPDRRLLDLFGIEHPIIQAPMAGAQGSAMAIAVSEAGGLGSLPCALLKADAIRSEVLLIRQRTERPFNLNFFCHRTAPRDRDRESRWLARLSAYRTELGVEQETIPSERLPFDDAMCELVESIRPRVVSFHFGLPATVLVERVKRAGSRIIASATTVAEARWLEDHGVDAVIAQGAEAGGHRGIFLSEEVASQPGTFALVPQVVDAVRVPVIAAGGIGDARGILAALALGAAAVQIGTAFLLTSEATLSPVHRAALKAARDDQTVLTNVFTGRPARALTNRIVRELGPMNADAPAFPVATNAMLPLRMKAEAAGSGDFTSLWSGQAACFAREMPAGEFTRELAMMAQAKLHG